MGVEERIEALELRPDMATLTLGTCNFGDDVFENSLPTIRTILERIRRYQIVPELEIFDIGMLATADVLFAKGLLTPPAHFDFVLGVPGINYSYLLDRSTDFAPFDGLMTSSYPNRLDRALLLAVAQVLWDRTDPNGHVRHTTADTYPGTPPKKLLYQVAYGDHQVANLTVELAARSNGAHLQTPALDPSKVVPDVEPFFGIPAIPAYPFDGSAVVIWDSGNPAPPIENLPPPAIDEDDPEWADLTPCARNWDSDPHECPRRDPDARLQKSEFLKDDGAVVDTCGGVACTAPSF